jgi:2-polyprenyl-3-methyl-5-hydroxy-6-metoxy-1,4-benzoquinol methylase
MIAGHLLCSDHSVSAKIFPISRCNSCGFLFTQDYPEITEIDKYYESPDYISHSDTSEGIINKIYHLIRRVMLLRKRNIIQKLTGLQKGALLDVGSGTGHFASLMKESGWDVKGIEINEKARNFSTRTFGLEVITPDNIASLQAGSFDCATMWHVLEHFYDPQKYITDVMTLLRPGGICLVALPNCSSLDAQHYGKFWAAYDVPRHLWHFNPHSFSLFVEKSRLSIECQLILPFDVFYISALSEKYKGSRWPFLKGIAWGKWFASLTLFNRNKSSSVIYVIRKLPDQ